MMETVRRGRMSNWLGLLGSLCFTAAMILNILKEMKNG